MDVAQERASEGVVSSPPCIGARMCLCEEARYSKAVIHLASLFSKTPAKALWTRECLRQNLRKVTHLLSSPIAFPVSPCPPRGCLWLVCRPRLASITTPQHLVAETCFWPTVPPGSESLGSVCKAMCQVAEDRFPSMGLALEQMDV